MPGSTPAISQLDWLISITAMIVLFWSRATRDLLKACPGAGRGRSAGAARHSIGYMQRRSCHFLAARPIASLGPAEDLQRPWPASVPVRGRLFLVTEKSGRGDFRGLEDLGRVTRDREFEAGFLRLASLLETKLHSSRSIGQVARQWAQRIKP